MNVLRQNVGIDIAKDSFVATVTVLFEGQIINHLNTKLFKNKTEGFEDFCQWVYNLTDKSIDVNYTMEATGVYYEGLAYYLWNKKEIVHVLLPNKAKNFAQSLNIKSKTDKIDSQILGQMGAERVLERWNLSSPIYRKLRTLTRERQQIVKERTRCKNQLHAETHKAESLKTTINRYKRHIKYLIKLIITIEKEIKRIISKDAYLVAKIIKMKTIPGISNVSAATIVAETAGFVNIKNTRQLVSYAGYDIVLKESGMSKGKTRISKKGNSRIRHALFMVALTAKTHSKTMNEFYERLNTKKNNGMISLTAVQRKILALMYTLWKTDSVYIEHYEKLKAC